MGGTTAAQQHRQNTPAPQHGRAGVRGGWVDPGEIRHSLGRVDRSVTIAWVHLGPLLASRKARRGCSKGGQPPAARRRTPGSKGGVPRQQGGWYPGSKGGVPPAAGRRTPAAREAYPRQQGRRTPGSKGGVPPAAREAYPRQQGGVPRQQGRRTPGSQGGVPPAAREAYPGSVARRNGCAQGSGGGAGRPGGASPRPGRHLVDQHAQAQVALAGQHVLRAGRGRGGEGRGGGTRGKRGGILVRSPLLVNTCCGHEGGEERGEAQGGRG